jgi:hypothetical protein
VCTVSWLRAAGGYDLFCNRDERLARADARAPAVRERAGARYVAPLDGDFGGTWLAANEHGLTLCLLNHYEVETGERAGDDTAASADARVGERSRGLLLIDLIDCLSPSQVRARLTASELPRYRPFTLLALDARGASLFARWSNARLAFDAAPRAPLVSSSFETARVVAAREESFRRRVVAAGGASVERLARFHRGHDPRPGPASVCMHRADAATVSLSRVSVREESVEFEYRAGAPCEGGGAVKVTLPRAKP